MIDNSIAVSLKEMYGVRYDDKKQEEWKSSDLGADFENFISQLETLVLSGNTKTKVPWILERLRILSRGSWELWIELQEEKAKPKWIKMKSSTGKL